MAPPQCCEECYFVWLPAAHFMPFLKFAAEYHCSDEHRKRLDAARSRRAKAQSMPLPDSEVSGENKLTLSVVRRGLFLPKNQVKSMCYQSTPKQLRLGELVEVTCPGQSQPLTGYIVSDPSKPLLDVEVASHMTVGTMRLTMPSGSQTVEGLKKFALVHLMRSSDAVPEDALGFLKGGAATLDELKARGKKVEELRSARRSACGGTAEGGDEEGHDADSGEAASKPSEDGGDDNDESATDDGSKEGDGGSSSDEEGPQQSTHKGCTGADRNPSRSSLVSLVKSFHQPELILMLTNGGVSLMDVPLRNDEKQRSVLPSPAKSLASASEFGDGDDKKKGGASALPPSYWIERLDLTASMQGWYDKRLTNHAETCVDREMEPNKDNLGARRLQKHLVRFALVRKLCEEVMPVSTPEEVTAACGDLVLAGHPPPLSVLVSLVRKRAENLLRISMSGAHMPDFAKLLDCVLPFERKPAPKLTFDIAEARLAPLALTMEMPKAIALFTKFVVSSCLAARIANAEGQRCIDNIKMLCRTLLVELELSDDMDPPDAALDMLDACFTAARTIAFLCEPVVRPETDLVVINDTDQLYKACVLIC